VSASSRERARTLELIMRAAAAEERLLSRRLERVAEAQRRTREDAVREQQRGHRGRAEENGRG
jgi:hypothetical protein